MPLRRPEDTVVRTDDQLTALWRDMMGAGGFAQRSLWMIALADDGSLCPAVQIIDDVPESLDAELLGGLRSIVADFVADGVTFAFALTRPGPVAMQDTDRRWARQLRDGLGELLRWPIHLATYERVVVFAPDDLLAA